MRKFVAVLTASLFLVAAGWAETENILNNFNLSNGGYPYAPVILDSSGNVYGMTDQGGTNGCGVVYQLVNSGGTWTENDIYNFTCGADGGSPLTNGLAIDSSENLYGTTPIYGAYGFGVVFKLTNSGGTWTQTVLYSFTGDTDGAFPYAGVTIDAQGNLFGTAQQGGGGGCPYGCGVVYKLTKSGGVWKETVLHVFKQNGTDGYDPFAPVTLDSAGDIYGTTPNGGGFAQGTVFKLSKAKKKGVWKEAILHYFFGRNDGCNPYSGVALDSAGAVYGTTYNCGSGNFGVVYQLKRSGGKYTNNVILTFNNSNGEYPYDYGTVLLDASGNVYGTASSGGAYRYYGTVFKLAAGTWDYTDLHDFQNNGTDGYSSFSGLAIDASGNLYGTTNLGGSGGYGTLYQIVP